VIESVGSSINSGIANLHLVPNEPFKQLSPEQQKAAKRELEKALQRVLKKTTKTYLPELHKKMKKMKKAQKAKSTPQA
jgi:hypothetical protein